MTTVIINTKSKAAKVMVEYLKTQPYAKIVEEKKFNYGVQQSIEEAKNGKVIRAMNADDLIAKLNK